MFNNMKVGSCYCTRCGREVYDHYCNNCEPHTNIKQLTIEELRKQFERETIIPKEIYWDGEDYMYYGHDRDLNIMLDEIRVRWYGWKCCAKTNNLLNTNYEV